MSEAVKLSDGEKLILLMLCELYDHLKVKGEIAPQFIREAIYSGNLWGLASGYTGVFHGEETSGHVVSETISVLAMWRRLEESYEGLSPEDKDWLKQQEGGYVPFYGFDNNNEVPHISAARFLIDQLGRFENFKGRSLDAHMPTIEVHRRMLKVFDPILHQVLNRDFSAAQINEVMLSRVHPDRRNV